MQDVVLTQSTKNIMLTQLNSQIGREVVPDLVDQFKILKEEADHDFFKEVYIKAKNATSYDEQALVGSRETTLPPVDLTRPIYHNPYKNEYYDVENLALRFYSLH
jgi:hypothetical protein